MHDEGDDRWDDFVSVGNCVVDLCSLIFYRQIIELYEMSSGIEIGNTEIFMEIKKTQNLVGLPSG